MERGVVGNSLELSEVEKLSSVVRVCMAGSNSKARQEGEYLVAVEPNSFGIPSVETCPGRTDYCEMDCYAIEAEHRTATEIKLIRNLALLQDADATEGMTDLLRDMLASYRDAANKLGVETKNQRFRIHWSGDFFSLDYAQAWRSVITENPDINFFVFTRSFRPDLNVVPILAGLDNLDLLLSVDRENVTYVQQALEGNDGVRIAYLVDYLEEVDELREKTGRVQGYRKRACPENMRDATGARGLPVISKRGGACSVCTYCINKPETWDVVFVKTGYEKRANEPLPIIDSVPIDLTPRRERRELRTQQRVGAAAVLGKKVQQKQPELFEGH